MEKKCFSIMTPDFEKSIKNLGKNKVIKVLEKIAKLEEIENNLELLP